MNIIRIMKKSTLRKSLWQYSTYISGEENELPLLSNEHLSRIFQERHLFYYRRQEKLPFGLVGKKHCFSINLKVFIAPESRNYPASHKIQFINRLSYKTSTSIGVISKAYKKKDVLPSIAAFQRRLRTKFKK